MDATPSTRPALQTPLLTAAAISLLITALPRTAVAGHWSHDFETAESQSRSQRRPMLLHFSAPWCGPCRRMSAETLHQPQTLAMLDQAVGVEIDIERRPDLKTRFGITSLPTDIVLSPDGQVVMRRSNFADVYAYMASVGAAIAQATPPRQPSPRQPSSRPPVRSRPSEPETQLVDRNVAPEPPASPPPTSSPVRTRQRLPMVRGYSVVALHDRREWVKGSDEFSAEHRGQLYYFVDDQERQQFLRRPRQYTPRLLGCDAVVFQNEDRATLGSVDFAAFYGTDLFLFASDQSRRAFKADPERFMQTRVVTLDEIETVVR